MGRFEDEWQDTDFILKQFGRSESSARKKYAEFVEEGISHSSRGELTGGGLIRSVGGWKEIRPGPTSN
jgi:hypothetical protein